MVLHVDFAHLAEEALRFNVKPWVFLATAGNRLVATIGDASSNLLIQSETPLSMEGARQVLAEQGLLVAQGRWLPDPLAGELQIQEQLWMASIAYKSSEDKPGLWIHAYRGTPSAGDVIRDFYEEMSAEASLENVSLDEFVGSVHPNVVILGPNELAAFADATK